jgi:hypothetical protein
MPDNRFPDPHCDLAERVDSSWVHHVNRVHYLTCSVQRSVVFRETNIHLEMTLSVRLSPPLG